METTFDYLRQFGPLLAERILATYPPLQSTKDPVAPCLSGLLRKPLPAQAVAITGTAKYLRDAKSARIVAECGAGKTFMALGAIHILSAGRPTTTLVMCPSHITHKWARESEQLALPFTTPISEVAVLLLAHPQVTLSQAALSRIAEAGGSVVTIDGHFLPASMQLPVQAHFPQTERFAKQMQLSLPLRKRLWQQIVRAKIRAQGELLKELHGNDAGLIAMSARPAR